MAARSKWLAYAFCCIFFVAGCGNGDDDNDNNGSGAAPTSTQIANQTVNQGTSTSAIPFTVADSDTSDTSLTVSGSSSNTTLVPNSNIVFGGSGANRTVTVTPAAGQSGTATITYNVSDGSHTTSHSFTLTVTGGTSGKTFDTPQDAAAIAASLSSLFNKVGASSPTGAKGMRAKAAKVAFPCQDGGTFEQTSDNTSTAFAGDGTIVFTNCANHDTDGNNTSLNGQFVIQCTDTNQTTTSCNGQTITAGQQSTPFTVTLENSGTGADVQGQFYNLVVTAVDDGNQQTSTFTIEGRLVITDNSTDSCGNADITVHTVEPLTVDNNTGAITAGELSLTAADGSTARVVFNPDGSETVTVNGVSDTFTPTELQTVCGQ